MCKRFKTMPAIQENRKLAFSAKERDRISFTIKAKIESVSTFRVWTLCVSYHKTIFSGSKNETRKKTQMKYSVVGDRIEFVGRSKTSRRAGRRPGPRLKVLMDISGLTLSDIARIYAANRTTIQLKNGLTVNCMVTRVNLSRVIAGKDNSPAYIHAIEKAWKLPIDRIRELHRLDRSKAPISRQELSEFGKQYSREHFPEVAKAADQLFNLGAAA